MDEKRPAKLNDIMKVVERPVPIWRCPGCGTSGPFAKVFRPNGPGAQSCLHCPGQQGLPVEPPSDEMKRQGFK